MARTCEYDNSPVENPARTNARSPNACATRRCSWAVRRLIEHCQLNQCVHDRHSHDAHPSRRSNSATNNNHRHIAAARCPANVLISASSRSVAISAARSITPAPTSGASSTTVDMTNTSKA